MGDKIEAKRTAKRLGIPVVPGSDGGVRTNGSHTHRRGNRLSGHHQGVGRRRRPRHEGRAERGRPLEALSTARTEAGAAFGDDAVYIEKYLQKPRHIEVQVMGDGNGSGMHLGERDCSLQRRHQKVWEEANSPALNSEERERIGVICANAIADLGYQAPVPSNFSTRMASSISSR